jgi:hypothetical protein
MNKDLVEITHHQTFESLRQEHEDCEFWSARKLAKVLEYSEYRHFLPVIEKAKKQGATDKEIHDTVLIAALFCLYNRYVDGLSTVTPVDTAFYKGLGQRLKDHGYNRLPQGYDHLKNKH